jgi:nucleotide-binding universal stress UspA family protein
MFRRLLCATDGSVASEKAVNAAIEIAKTTSAPLTFLTVNPIPADYSAYSPFWDSTLLSASEAMSDKILRTAAEKAQSAGLKDATWAKVDAQNVSAAIVSYAESNNFDHLFVGSLGRTGLSRLLLGSVAGDVVALAHCPVTIVR